MEQRNSSPWSCSISKTLAWPPLDSTCVGLSAVLGTMSWIVSDIWGFLLWFHVAEIWRLVETSQKVHSQSICDHHGVHFLFFPQFHQSSAPLIIMHRRTTIFKLARPLEHTCTIHSFITICSFYLIVNLNQSFSFPNETTDDIVYFALGGRLGWHFSRNLFSHRQFSMYWSQTNLIAERRNQCTQQCSQDVEKKSLWPWDSQYTYFLDMSRMIYLTSFNLLVIATRCF